MRIQFSVTDVHKPLAAMAQMVKNGSRVVFDGVPDESGYCAYSVHKATGKVTPFYIRNGVYNFKVKVSKSASERAMREAAEGFARQR